MTTKPTNLNSQKTTAHSQAAEFAALAGVASQPADTTQLAVSYRDAIAKLTAEQDAHDATRDQLTATNGSLIEANAQVEALTAELAAEKEAHAKTQAALTAAVATPPAA
jgi:hypothetical protein